MHIVKRSSLDFLKTFQVPGNINIQLYLIFLWIRIHFNLIRLLVNTKMWPVLILIFLLVNQKTRSDPDQLWCSRDPDPKNWGREKIPVTRRHAETVEFCSCHIPRIACQCYICVSHCPKIIWIYLLYKTEPFTALEQMQLRIQYVWFLGQIYCTVCSHKRGFHAVIPILLGNTAYIALLCP